MIIHLFKIFQIIFIFSQGGVPPSSYQQPGFYPQEQQSILLASLEQYQGTVFPAPNFNAEADCQALSHAMKGAGKLKYLNILIRLIYFLKVQMNVLSSILLLTDRIYNVNK